MLVESLLLACLGGVLGLALATAGMRVLQRLGRDALPRLDGVGLNGGVLAFALVATVVTAVVFRVVPALRLARIHPSKHCGNNRAPPRAARGLARLRGTLAAAQVALALTLVAGAAVLLASLHRLQQVDSAFASSACSPSRCICPRLGTTPRAARHSRRNWPANWKRFRA